MNTTSRFIPPATVSKGRPQQPSTPISYYKTPTTSTPTTASVKSGIVKRGYVLAVVTATGCGHCTKFKQLWPTIKSRLGNRIRVVEINQNSVNFNFDKTYPTNLNLFCRWFPTLCLFYEDEWNSKELIYGDIFNGYISEGKANLNTRLQDTTYENIDNWLKTKGV